MNLKSAGILLLGVGLLVGGVSIGSSAMTDVMQGDFSVFTAIKWSTIVVGAALGLGFLLKNKVIGNENLEEGERGFRRRWGKVITKRRTKERKLLFPGKKHLYIKHYHDVLVQSVRVRTSPQEPDLSKFVRATYHGTNICYLLQLDWHVIDEEKAIHRSLTSVHQVNRAREGDDALENFVVGRVNRAIFSCLNELSRDSQGLPIFSVDLGDEELPARLRAVLVTLRDNYGVSVLDASPVLCTVAPEERLRGSLPPTDL